MICYREESIAYWDVVVESLLFMFNKMEVRLSPVGPKY
jgi:hypothetical protein